MEISNFNSIENQITEVISKIRQEFPDRTNYYYSLDNPIVSHLGLQVHEVNDVNYDGLYIPSKKIIAINNNISYMERRNFSLFHEITHYLISIDDDITSFLMQFHAGKEKEFQKYIESLCNLGAGEFLAPISQIREEIERKNFSIELLRNLDQIFPASKPAIMFQLARSASHKCTLVIIDRRKIPQYIQQKNLASQTNQIIVDEYYILYSATSKTNKYRPGRFTIIPKHHMLRNAFEDESLIKGVDYIPYKGGNSNHRCSCEAMFFQGKVYGLFNIESPINGKLQPRLL